MIDGKKIMFGKIFITQLRNCVMLVTPLPDNLPVTQPTVSKHWREITKSNEKGQTRNQDRNCGGQTKIIFG